MSLKELAIIETASYFSKRDNLTFEQALKIIEKIIEKSSKNA